jgi:RDD family
MRDRYTEALTALTFGTTHMLDDDIVLGPITLLQFGSPAVGERSVEWPVEGGLLARAPGGRWRVEAVDGEVRAELTGFAPRLPRIPYALTHLQVHRLFTRLYLLRLRGREPAPAVLATRDERFQAASVDIALCLTLAGGLGARRRLRRTLVLAAVYHVACWSFGGRTLGGLVMRQRVVAVDGATLTPAQALMRLVLIPASWLLRRPVHDELACTDVIADR